MYSYVILYIIVQNDLWCIFFMSSYDQDTNSKCRFSTIQKYISLIRICHFKSFLFKRSYILRLQRLFKIDCPLCFLKNGISTKLIRTNENILLRSAGVESGKRSKTYISYINLGQFFQESTVSKYKIYIIFHVIVQVA